MNEDYTKIDQSHTQINISSGGRRASHDFQQKQNSQVRFCRLKHLYRIWNSESFLCEISAGSLELFWKIYMENFTSDSARNSAQLSLNNSRSPDSRELQTSTSEQKNEISRISRILDLLDLEIEAAWLKNYMLQAESSLKFKVI